MKWPGPVRRVDPLRHDPLEAHGRSLPEQGLAIGTLDITQEPKRFIPSAQQARQSLAASVEWHPSKILTVEAKEIERDQAAL